MSRRADFTGIFGNSSSKAVLAIQYFNAATEGEARNSSPSKCIAAAPSMRQRGCRFFAAYRCAAADIAYASLRYDNIDVAIQAPPRFTSTARAYGRPAARQCTPKVRSKPARRSSVGVLRHAQPRRAAGLRPPGSRHFWSYRAQLRVTVASHRRHARSPLYRAAGEPLRSA